MRLRPLVLVLVLLLALPAVAAAAEPRASLPDIEDEVMCTQCGTPLNVSDAVVADKQRDLIKRLIDQGKTKPEIKAALKEEYGPRVLAVPTGGEVDWAAWAVPLGLGLLGLAGIGLAARRWRRQRGDGSGPAGGAPAALGPEDSRRLDAELAAFDR